ncbi:MAG TPA: AMP-binding protein [Acidimicrobiales bacterium]|nr:AMP-binding protein [Acidimicrobiales bacterium]
MYARRHASEHPDRPAIVMATSGRTVTFKEYEDRANQVAHLLRDAGLGRGDHISIFSENNPEMLEIQAAAERIGIYYTLVNSHLAPEEVAYIVTDSQSRALFSSVARREVAEPAADGCPGLERMFMIGLDSSSGRWEPYEGAIRPLPVEPVSDESMGAPMLYSSGTTGHPKGIYRELPEGTPEDQPDQSPFFRYIWGFREGMVYLNPAPLYHSAPQRSVALALNLGCTSIVMEKFDPEQWLQLVERYQVTQCQMVPTMFSRLLRLPEDVRLKYDTSSLETIIHAAAPCPVPIKQAMIDWVGPVLNEYYAATEGNGCTFCTSEEWLKHPGTVGRCLLGTLMILDENGDQCPAGVDGTVWFAGATNFEYFRDPKKTADSRTADGNASTVGDVGHVDEDGWLYLTDRKSYMIISGGVNIYPQETENLLVTHPAVMDAAVLGVPNEDLGEEVRAVVQLVDPASAGPAVEAELIRFCREHLAAFKCPRTVDFVDELPRLPTGKLYKRLLREKYWQGHQTSIV